MAKTRGKPVKKRAKSARPARASRAPKTARGRAREPGWIDGGKGYELSIQDGAIVARKGDKLLAAVPAAIKASDAIDRLGAAVDFLTEHARQCVETVEAWMLRSLATPRRVLDAVFADPDWRRALADAWVVPVDAGGRADPAAGGFLKAIEVRRGVGVVDRDGETTWIDTDRILIPHPVLLDAIDDLRSMAVELGASQGISQLFRETFARPRVPPPDPTAIDGYAGARFAQLAVASNVAKGLGYRVIGGAAACRVLEGGRFVEARFYLGDGDPFDEVETGELYWIDDQQKQLAVLDVPPVAFSEGMRMAALIHARRKTDKEDGDA